MLNHRKQQDTLEKNHHDLQKISHQKLAFEENQNFDLMSQLQGYGLQTVIIQEQQSDFQQSQRLKRPSSLNQNNLKITTEFDHDHQDFLDYSNINLKLEQSRQLSLKFKSEILKKLKPRLKQIKQKIMLPKKQLIQIKIGFKQIFSEFKFSMSRIQNEINQKINTTLVQINSRKDSQVNNNRNIQINSLEKQLLQKKNLIRTLQHQNTKLNQNLKQFQYKHNQNYNTMYIENIELKNKCEQLQRENYKIKIEMASTQCKQQQQFKQGSMINSITSHQIELKHKHLIIMKNFSDQIQKLQRQLEQMRLKDKLENQKLKQWEQQLEKQQLQINQVVGRLEEREKVIRHKELQIQIKLQSLQQKQLTQHRLSNQQHNQQGYSFKQEQKPHYNHNNKNRHYGHNAPNFKINRANGYQRNLIKNSSSADALIRNGRGNHKNFMNNAANPSNGSHIYSLKYDLQSDRKRPETKLTSRIIKIQESIKKQLHQMGY